MLFNILFISFNITNCELIKHCADKQFAKEYELFPTVSSTFESKNSIWLQFWSLSSFLTIVHVVTKYVNLTLTLLSYCSFTNFNILMANKMLFKKISELNWNFSFNRVGKTTIMNVEKTQNTLKVSLKCRCLIKLTMFNP